MTLTLTKGCFTQNLSRFIELENNLFFELLQVALGNRDRLSKAPSAEEWEEIYAESERQAVTGILLHGIEKLSAEQRPAKVFLLQWIGEVMQNYETRYANYEKAISSLARFYNQHGYKMMVLKGYACSLNWPNPNHRPCGDIDVWLFGRQREADAALAREKGIKIDNSHHHHTVFFWGDFMVENHYDFVNVHTRKSSAELEKIFKSLGEDDSYSVEVLGEKVYMPSPNLHALFLAKHMASHFTGANITLRQVLDWAFFFEKHSSQIDRDWLIKMLKDFHLDEFMNSINAICVDELGFDAKIFPSVQFNPEIKSRVLNDIIQPEFEEASPKQLIPRLIYKFRRWQGNAWKQRLCYNESRWSAFWTGVWAKMLKPASI